MKYATLGATGTIVSRLSLGTMTFTSGDRSVEGLYKTDAAAADALVGRAFDAGVNFFDTADAYARGQSEEILGAALKSRRNRAIIATKVGIRTGSALTQSGLGRRHILWSVDESLRRLGTDWIDVYIAHVQDPFTPLEETLSALDAVVRSGKVRYLGFSNWSAWMVSAALEIQKANGLAPFTHGQVNYSLLCRDIEHDFVSLSKRYGLGLTVWSPLAGGFLSGKYTRENLTDPANRFSSFDILPFDKENGFRLVEKLRLIAQRRSASVAQVALAWLLARPFITSVIVGAARMGQLEDNLGAADLELTGAEIAELDAATPLPPIYPSWTAGRMVDRSVVKALS
jgi:aryl-alcohol dehydrogenase-like predicted oxidoreductase